MGVRCFTSTKKPYEDTPKPKKVENDGHAHLNCPKTVPKELIDVYLQDDTDEGHMCCNNCCVYCVFDLVKIDNLPEETDNLPEDIDSNIKIAKLKNLYTMLVIQDGGNRMVKKLNTEKYDKKRVILTQEQYNMLMHSRCGDGGTIFEAAIDIETCFIEEWLKPANPSDKIPLRLGVTAYKRMRDRVGSIIDDRIKLLEL